MDVLEDQLRRADWNTTRCTCCDHGHVAPDGRVITCDRVAVKECIEIWFGSPEAFEQCLQSEVLETLTSKLRKGAFTRGYLHAMTCPVLWAFQDILASWVRNAQWDLALEALLFGLLESWTKAGHRFNLFVYSNVFPQRDPDRSRKFCNVFRSYNYIVSVSDNVYQN